MAGLYSGSRARKGICLADRCTDIRAVEEATKSVEGISEMGTLAVVISQVSNRK